jgi:hypothetical protein
MLATREEVLGEKDSQKLKETQSSIQGKIFRQRVREMNE